MKKTLFVLVVGGLLLSSCAKEYDCSCKVTHEQTGQGFSEKREFEERDETVKGSKENAKNACKSFNYTESYTDAAGYTQKITQKCEFD